MPKQIVKKYTELIKKRKNKKMTKSVRRAGEDEDWKQILPKLHACIKKKILEENMSITDISKEIKICDATLRKYIFDNVTPKFLIKVRIEEWIKKQ